MYRRNRSSCASGKRIGALLLQRVLRRQDEERVGQRVGLAARAHLPLLHGLQHGRLGLGRGAVDLIGQDHIGKQRTVEELVCPPARLHVLLDDLGPCHVAGHEVGRELDPFEGKVRGLGKRAHQQGFRQARHTLQKGVAAREDGGQHLLDHLVLAHDHLGNFRADGFVGLLAPLYGGHVVLRGIINSRH